MTTPINTIIDRLERAGKTPKQHGERWQAKCPAHPDNNPSLSISNGTEPGTVLLHCFAGCTPTDITAALGLELKDLFPPKERNELVELEHYTYTTADGTPALRVHRFEPKTFRQSHWNGTSWQWGAGNTPKLLYRLPQVRQAITNGEPIYIVEGERDVHTLEHMGYTATTNAGGAGKFLDEHAQQLTGATSVIIIADDDPPGHQHAQRVQAELNWLGIPSQIHLPATGCKDITQHVTNGHSIEQLRDYTPDTTEPTTADVDTVEPTTEHGWEPANLAEVLAADYQPPTPTICKRTDGTALFYKGRINALFGESGSGKSWVAMATCAEQINQGNHVIYIDYEDHVGSVANRMIKLGCNPNQVMHQFHYINPMQPFGTLASIDLVELITTTHATLCVIDSTGEAMALDGAEPNSDDDTARWFRKLPRLLAHNGPCVILLDHMPKSNEANQGFAIGSQRKRAAIDGAAFRVEVGVAPVKGGEGHLKLVTAKDRGGYHQHGHKAAEIDITDTPTGIAVTIKPPGTGLPTILMGRISEYLTAVGPQSQNNIQTNVAGNSAAIRTALQKLVDLGYVERTVRAGKSGGFDHHIVRPFNELDLYQTPTVTTATNRDQTDVVTVADLTVTTATTHTYVVADGHGWNPPEDTPQEPTVTTTNGHGWDLFT